MDNLKVAVVLIKDDSGGDLKHPARVLSLPADRLPDVGDRITITFGQSHRRQFRVQERIWHLPDTSLRIDKQRSDITIIAEWIDGDKIDCI